MLPVVDTSYCKKKEEKVIKKTYETNGDFSGEIEVDDVSLLSNKDIREFVLKEMEKDDE